MKMWRENIISITSTEVSQVLLLSVEVYISFIPSTISNQINNETTEYIWN